MAWLESSELLLKHEYDDDKLVCRAKLSCKTITTFSAAVAGVITGVGANVVPYVGLG